MVRVTTDGRRVPVEQGWSGYQWADLVRDRGLYDPSTRHHADASLDNQLAFLHEALDYVARHTPRDTATEYLEATVTYWKDAHAPKVVVMRSRRARRRGERRPHMGAGGRRARAAGQHACARRATGGRRARDVAALAPVSRDARHGFIYRDAFYQPYASWYPELPRGAVHRDVVGRGRRGDRDGRRPLHARS